MKKTVKCVITQEIVNSTKFFSADCYAIKAMKNAGINDAITRNNLYLKVSKRPSTINNNNYGEDLCALDNNTIYNKPTLPLEFEVTIDQ